MKKTPTKQEWEDMLRPLLATAYKPSVRRKLCRMHRDGPVKESKLQCPWPSGENALVTINGSGMKSLLTIPSGGTVLYEYNANGDLVNVEGTGMEEYLRERGLL